VDAVVKIDLTVWDFAMPAQPTVVYDVNSYGSPAEPDHRDPYTPTPKAVIEAEHKFYRLFNRHRMYMNIMPVHSQRGAPLTRT